ncbi:MAG TPA: PEP/pyruvate-binding domain-containing protein, partial [Bacteroidales bacterium]|nr:PEP/pyruvate-binding domain-containing protein [Bacteroidales bacterium]
MTEKFKSKALEANLAETRYKNIQIEPDYLQFINLSKNYFGINKRANDCIIEFQHPFSNRKFVTEELRNILLTDYWFYIALDDPDIAFSTPVKLLEKLLTEEKSVDYHVMIIRTLLEFIQKLAKETKDHSKLIEECLTSIQNVLENDSLSLIKASKYFNKYLKDLVDLKQFKKQILVTNLKIYKQNIEYWENSTKIETWIKQHKEILAVDQSKIKHKLGKPWFTSLRKKLSNISDWKTLVSELPDYDMMADTFASSISLFSNFIEKFYYSFYLLQLEGMNSHKERVIWNLNSMLKQTMDEVDENKLIVFIDQIFSFCYGLRKEHTSSVLDILLTLGKKIIDIDDSSEYKLTHYFEDKLIDFGFESPGIVYVNEDWQLSANKNHIKNIGVWLELIEYSQLEMEKLLSVLIVNLQLGGIFLNDTDLFQREITKILNSNIVPFYKNVKQLTRIFPVYFNEIGAEGEIRKVTTSMDEIAYRKDKLIHFLRKQVHTESNNTLIVLTRQIFNFWYDGNQKAIKDILPTNVYDSIDQKSEYYAPVHKMVVRMCKISKSNPTELLDLSDNEYEILLEQLNQDNNRDIERLRDIRLLYAFLKEKYSFETVDITNVLKRYSYIKDSDIEEFKLALDENDFGTSLKLIYSFMSQLKEVIFNPKPSQAWENIYHKRHIAIGIPSMYGTYREPKFEALGLTFRLENVATRLMEKVVNQINLNYISAKTMKDIYVILDYFREGLELDGITNQSLNSNLLMLKYSLRSQSLSFDQYINIFKFLAEDVKRTIIKYFLKSYEIPLRKVIPQLFDKEHKLSAEDEVNLVNSMSEKFYRDVIAEAFLMQPLDNFITKILESLREMADNLSPTMIKEVMSYNSDLVIARLGKQNPQVDNQLFLGSKAYHLKNLRLAGFPIPPGFVLTTEVFRRHKAIFEHPELKNEFYDLIRQHLSLVERAAKKEFGNPKNPLLLSVRSGTAISMPGAMDTLLNVGMNDKITLSLSKKRGFEWSAWDSYRRLLQSWGMAFGLIRDEFDNVMEVYKAKYNVDQKTEFSPKAMRDVAMAYKKTIENKGIKFEEDVFSQLIITINLVFESWSSERAKVYREHLEIADEWGTAVVIQQMIFGNMHHTSGTGVVFTQDPTKEKQGVSLYGDFTFRSQGEDIVAGLVKPLPIGRHQKSSSNNNNSLQETCPDIYSRLHEMSVELTEDLGYSPQEIEFTFESEKSEDLYILQIRDQDMATHQSVDVFKASIEKMKLVGRGIGVGGGAMNGRVAFDNSDITKLK